MAAGKGVVVANNKDEACAAVDEILGDKKYGSAGSKIVVEEKLSGEEVSVCDASNMRHAHKTNQIKLINFSFVMFYRESYH